VKFDTDFYIAQLRYDGVDAIAVSQVDGQLIKATIVDASGHQSFAFFDKDTLTPVKW
jgi:sugar/nucleoside kinase (ribokinase family)